MHPYLPYRRIAMSRLEKQTERFEMKASPEFLARLDQWRRKQPDLPNRSEAIRRLVEQALKQGKREKRST